MTNKLAAAFGLPSGIRKSTVCPSTMIEVDKEGILEEFAWLNSRSDILQSTVTCIWQSKGIPI
jgi:hypothetical protein